MLHLGYETENIISVSVYIPYEDLKYIEWSLALRAAYTDIIELKISLLDHVD